MRVRPLGKTGLDVSEIGFGAATLGDEYFTLDPAEGTRAVHAAIDAGINFFDTSPYYGRTLSESRLGQALQGKRDKVILCTKAGRYDYRGFDFSYERILRSIDESLARLRTDYVDVLLAHDIEFGDERQVLEETFPALGEIQRQGKARFIGCSCLPLKLLARVAVQAKADLVISYARYNLLVDDMDELLTPALQAAGIGLVLASPLHLGVLTNGAPPAWHPGAPQVFQAAALAAAYCRERGYELSSIALRFCLEHAYAAPVLSGMGTVAEVERNLRAVEESVPEDVVAGVRAILAPVHNATWQSGKPEYDDYPAFQFAGEPVA
jgi:L-galactose dehydrogenase